MPEVNHVLRPRKQRVIEVITQGKKMLHPWQEEYTLKFRGDMLDVIKNNSVQSLLSMKTTKLKVSPEVTGPFPWSLVGDGIKVHLLQEEKELVASVIASVTPTKSTSTPGKRSLDAAVTPHRSIDRLVIAKKGDNSAGMSSRNSSVEVKSIKKTFMNVQSNDYSDGPDATVEKRILSQQKLITVFTGRNSPTSINKSQTNGNYHLATTVIKPAKSTSAGALQRIASTSSSSSHNSQRKGPTSKIIRSDSYNHNKAFSFTPLSRQLSSTPGHVAHDGFKNLGNTCFMNAVIQALLSVEPFINAMASPRWNTLVTVIENRKDSLLAQMMVMIHHTKRKEHGPMDISSLKLAINQSDTFFISGRQEDAHEFLGFFLDKIQDEMVVCLKTWYKNYLKSSTPSVEKADLPVQIIALIPIYQYFHSEVTEWLTCNHCRVVKEPKEALFRHYEIALLPSQRTMRLEELLKNYFNSAEEREVRCDECKCNRIFSSKQKITVLPNVLIINLKRFCYDAERQRLDKDCRSVAIPSILNIEEFCASESAVTEAPVVMSVEEQLSGVTPFELMDNILVEEGKGPDASFVVSPRERKQIRNAIVQWQCPACTALNADDSKVYGACQCSKNVTNGTIFDDFGRTIGESPIAQTLFTMHYQYKLTAIVRHIGSSPYGGHYICDMAKQKDGNIVWKRCNDVKIETVKADDVLRDSSEPYILFFARDESTFSSYI